MDRDTQAVISALSETRYKWRTISGISKETGLSVDKIKEIIGAQSDQVVQSSALTPKGEPLFTTREKHHKETSAWSRIGLAIRNRAG